VPRRGLSTDGAVLGLRSWTATHLQRHLAGTTEHPKASPVRRGPPPQARVGLLSHSCLPQLLQVLCCPGPACGRAAGRVQPCGGPAFLFQAEIIKPRVPIGVLGMCASPEGRSWKAGRARVMAGGRGGRQSSLGRADIIWQGQV
jgi:hypothetical protein